MEGRTIQVFTYPARGYLSAISCMSDAAPTFFRSGHDSKINDSVGPSAWQGLDLGNIEVRVNIGSLIVPSGIIRQDAGTGLEV